MDFKNNPLYGISTVEELSKILEISIDDLMKGSEVPYRTFIIKKINKKTNKIKKRVINPYPDEKAETLYKLSICFQLLDYPEYVMSGWEGQNNLKNATAHVGAKETMILDVTHYFPYTQKKYVKNFLKEKLKISGEALECILKYVIHKNYLPTGSPTSSILAYFAHKELFDFIFKTMKKDGIKTTLYVDDITLSSKGHIGDWVIKYIKNTLKRHGLYLKKAKIKRFGYKGTKITGKFISQGGKITAPWHFSEEVKEMLNEMPIKEMSEKRLLRLLSKIGIIRETEPMKFIVQHNMAKKQIRRLHKLNKQKINNINERKKEWNKWKSNLLNKIHITET